MAVKVINDNQSNFIDDLIPPEEERFPGIKKVFVSLVLDISGSMQGNPIKKLEEAVDLFLREIKNDSTASKSAEIEIIGFGNNNVEVISGLNLVDSVSLTPLKPKGNTPMGNAINVALSRLEERKNIARKNGLTYWRPWLVLISDGMPTDMSLGDAKWQEIKTLINNNEDEKHAICWAFGTTAEAEKALSDLFPAGQAFSIDVADFSDIMKFVSDSISQVSGSVQNTKLAPIKRPDGKKLSMEI
jgi:uncharacterized protein YegL